MEQFPGAGERKPAWLSPENLVQPRPSGYPRRFFEGGYREDYTLNREDVIPTYNPSDVALREYWDKVDAIINTGDMQMLKQFFAQSEADKLREKAELMSKILSTR